MSFVFAQADSGQLRSVEYHPSHVYTYGRTTKYESVIPASVVVKVGDNGTVYLSVEDARALFDALPGVLAEHDAAVVVKAA